MLDHFYSGCAFLIKRWMPFRLQQLHLIRPKTLEAMADEGKERHDLMCPDNLPSLQNLVYDILRLCV